MFKRGFGLAFGPDTVTVSRMVCKRALAQNSTPHLAILFSSAKYDQKLLFETILDELNHIPVYGTTSPILISNAGVKRDCIILLLLSSDEISFSIHGGKCTENPLEIVKYLSSEYLLDHPEYNDMTKDFKSLNSMLACILTGTERHSRGNLYLEGFKESFCRPLPVSGGASVGVFPTEDLDLLYNGYQYCNSILAQEYLNLLFINAPQKNTAFSYAHECSWKPVTYPVKCTKTVHNVVYEVDGMPIFDYLEKALGKGYYDQLLYTRPRFSFVVKPDKGDPEKTVIRAITDWNFENKSITFWPYVDMAGEELRLVQLAREDLLAGAGVAAQKALGALNGKKPAVVFVFSCTVRSLLLHSKDYKEVEKIREVFGKDVPVIGFYCNAEYSPMYQKYADIVNSELKLSGSQQFGCSLAIFAIGTDETMENSGFDFTGELEKQWHDDVKKYDTSDQEKIKKLEEQLNAAENIITENEKALKYIINEHHTSNIQLRESNNALTAANVNNEKLQNLVKQYTPYNVWRKALVTTRAGLHTIPDEEMHCALMFMDVKGFTSYAETHTPVEVIRELNKIFAPATELIYKHGGDIDKFIGDCIFAMFTVPEKAYNAALEIQKKIQTLRAQGCPFHLRLGINYGRIISGNVGSDKRCENALIGDAVNLAQRLESACPLGSILMSEEFYKKLPEKIKKTCALKASKIKVKGKAEAVITYEITEHCISGK